MRSENEKELTHKEESEDLSPMPALDGDEEVKLEPEVIKLK